MNGGKVDVAMRYSLRSGREGGREGGAVGEATFNRKGGQLLRASAKLDRATGSVQVQGGCRCAPGCRCRG